MNQTMNQVLSPIERLLTENLHINNAISKVNILARYMGKSLPGYNDGATITASDYRKEFINLNKVVDEYNETVEEEIVIVADGVPEKGSKFRMYGIAFVTDEY